MKSVAGIFTSRDAAERVVQRLASSGIRATISRC